MSQQTATANETVVGGWSPYHPLTQSDEQVFEEAMNGWVGVTYKPQSVSTQIVNGENFKFKCQASMPPSEVIWEAIVEIYKPRGGKPYVTGIVKI